MANPNPITISYATYGPSGAETPAATYRFMSQDYKPPRRSRASSFDEVVNQNGTFRYVYDNGPAGLSWSPFTLAMLDRFEPLVGATATVQWANLLALWDHRGLKTIQAPDGIYEVFFSDSDLEPRFEVFPGSVGDKIEYRATISLEEG